MFSAEQLFALGQPKDPLALRQLELENRRLELDLLKAENERLKLNQGHVPSIEKNGFNLDTALRFVPKFREEEPELFFTHFERTAALHGWPKAKWVFLAQSSFIGRAQEIFTSLDDSLSLDYDAVRKVLNVYRKVPEAYRQQFRRCQKPASQTYVEFFRQKQLLCRRWVESSLATCDFDALLELIVMEEIKSCVPPKGRLN